MPQCKQDLKAFCRSHQMVTVFVVSGWEKAAEWLKMAGKLKLIVQDQPKFIVSLGPPLKMACSVKVGRLLNSSSTLKHCSLQRSSWRIVCPPDSETSVWMCQERVRWYGFSFYLNIIRNLWLAFCHSSLSLLWLEWMLNNKVCKKLDCHS